MTPTPTGKMVENPTGTYDLVLSRTFRAPVEDVWASVTEPERTARWFGAWRGEAGPGRTIELQMGFEEGGPWSDLRIDECRPPHRLAVSMTDGSGSWDLELNLAETPDGTTTLELVQHRIDPAAAENVGPGWEYYLDMLIASRENHPLPDFDDYYPAQAAHYADQAPA